MKSTINFLILFGLLLANLAYAQSPREQLNQLTVQLQQTSTDNTLRERIIKLAPTLKPLPTLPDKAVAFEGRARFAFEHAKSEDDFLVAAQEYEKAVAAAPWVAGYYADLCTIYEKAGKFEDAKRHCGFYLIGLTDPAQMTDVKRRIAGLEFGIEKANSRQTAKASKPAEPDFSGNWFGRDSQTYPYFVIEKNGEGWIVRDTDRDSLRIVRVQGRQLWAEGDKLGGWLTRHTEFVLSEDGQTIDVASKDTQSADQFSRMERDSPGGRLTDLDRYRHYTVRRK